MERFWKKVDKTGDCWIWMAAKTKRGYGHIRVGDKLVAAHRLAYELTYGSIPDGLEIDHTCCNYACVNPEHLEAVTHLENIRRWSQRRQRPTHCVRGHAFDDENTYVAKSGAWKCRKCTALHVSAWRKSKSRVKQSDGSYAWVPRHTVSPLLQEVRSQLAERS